MLIIGRAVQGIGGSGLMSGALIILNACVHPEKQAGECRAVPSRRLTTSNFVNINLIALLAVLMASK